MIEYKLGEKKIKIDFDAFLCLKFKDKKFYKSDFNAFSELYEFIDKNKMKISYMLFNNNEYFLENGVLHNLYGPAHIRINDKEDSFYVKGTKTQFFYIDGKLVYDKMDNRGCKKLEDFKDKEIFFYDELSNKKSGKDENGNFYRRKENIDYIKTIINLSERIKIDQRNKKIKKLIFII
jgi:hypothetical protein